MNVVKDVFFELGKILLKVQLSKCETSKILQTKSGRMVKEKILSQKAGKFWNQQNIFDRPDGLIVLTDHRLVFLSKVTTLLTETEFLSFPYKYIRNLEKTRIWLITPAVQFNVSGEKFVFTFFPGANTDEIIDIISERLS